MKIKRGIVIAVIVTAVLITGGVMFCCYKIGYNQGNKTGYTLARKETLHNPSYKELKEFLAKDKTNFNRYIKGKYVCLEFARDLNNNAEKQGIRAGVVFLKTKESPNGEVSGHFINCFQTDKGLIYIEPQNDKEVRVELNKSYLQLNNFTDLDTDKTSSWKILSIEIFW